MRVSRPAARPETGRKIPRSISASYPIAAPGEARPQREKPEEGDVVENTPATLEWAAAFNGHVDATDPAALTVGEIWNGIEQHAAVGMARALE